MSTTFNQALHIFRKDVRRLRLEIGGALALLLLFIATGYQTWDDMLQRGQPNGFDGPFLLLFANPTGGPRQMPDPNDFDGPFLWLLPLVGILLIARAIQNEALPGDRHFWLTRPYSRTGLLLAKALFIVACIHAPLFVAQAAIVALSGLPVLANLGGLLWMQVMVAAAFVAPAVAVAALTRNLAQFLPAAIFTGAFMAFAYALHGFEGDLDWIRQTGGMIAALIIGAAITWRQYRLRRTLRTAAFATASSVLAAILYLAFPNSAAVAIQSSIIGSQDPSFSLSLAAPKPLPPGANDRARRYGILQLPLTVRGAAAQDIGVMPAGITFRTLAGHTRRPYSRVLHENGELIQGTFVDRDYIQQAMASPVNIEAEYVVSQYGASGTAAVPMDGTPTYVEGLGQCGVIVSWDRRRFVCRSALESPSPIRSATLGGLSNRGPRSDPYNPFPSRFRLYPITAHAYELVGPAATDFAPAAPEPPASVTIMKPVAYFRYSLRAPNVRLTDYAIPPNEDGQ